METSGWTLDYGIGRGRKRGVGKSAATRRGVLAASARAGGAALAVPVLAACGAGGAGGGQAGSLVAKPTTIEVLPGFGPVAPESQWLDTLTAKVKELSPNLTVNMNVQQGGAGNDKLIAMISAGSAPDVHGTYVAQTSDLGAKKLLEPLQTLLKSAKDFSLADYFDGARDAFTYQGDLILAPQYTTPRGIGINLDHLNRTGLKTPASNWTWDEFTQYATKLLRREGSEIKVYGADFPTGNSFSAVDFFGCVLHSFGGLWADVAKGVVSFQKPEGTAALDLWVNLAQKLQVVPAAPPDLFKGVTGGAWLNGLASISYFFSTDVSKFKQQTPPSFPWTTVQMPRQKQGGAHFAQYGWGVLRAAKQKEGGAEFVRLASLPEHIAGWCIKTYGIVTRKAAANRKEWQDNLKAQPLLQPFSDAMSYTRTYPALAGWQTAMFATGGVGDAVDNARQGKVGAKAGLEEAARVMDNILAKAAADAK